MTTKMRRIFALALSLIAVPLTFAQASRSDAQSNALNVAQVSEMSTLALNTNDKKKKAEKPAASDEAKTSVNKNEPVVVTDPLVLLADEPTGNLDTARSHEIMELLARLNDERGLTIIMVTHEPDMAAFAHRTIRFLDGRIESDIAREAA